MEGAELAAVLPVCSAVLLRQRGLLLRDTPFALTLRGALAYNEADVITLDEGEEGCGEGASPAAQPRMWRLRPSFRAPHSLI